MQTVTTWNGDKTVVLIRDDSGQVWTPSDSAAAEIATADDPRQAALDICGSNPLRGEWKHYYS